MLTIKITCNTGNTWSTGFNGTFAEAEGYFLGATFTRELHDGTEIADRCISIELITGATS